VNLNEETENARMKNRYFVKPESRLTLQITGCSEATREALQRQTEREGLETLAEYCVDAVLSQLECDEDAYWDEWSRNQTSELILRIEAENSADEAA
jgi:hypothetical protein